MYMYHRLVVFVQMNGSAFQTMTHRSEVSMHSYQLQECDVVLLFLGCPT